MFERLKQFFKEPVITYLDKDFCEGKSSRELIDFLRGHNLISIGSGNMIILELLERLVKENEKEVK